MVSEDLFVSPAQVRVRYVFRNRAPRPSASRRLPDAGPRPDLRDESEVAYPGDFHTGSRAARCGCQVERRAMLRGVDRSAARPPAHAVAPARRQSRSPSPPCIERLPRADAGSGSPALGLDRLDPRRAGTSRSFRPGRSGRPGTGTRSFPPAATSRRARYAPGVGGTPACRLASRDYRQRRQWPANAAPTIASTPTSSPALDGCSARRARRQLSEEQRLRYILTTGGNWRSPIGDFRLVVDKGDRATRSSASAARACAGSARPSSRCASRNWRPDRDLAVLIVHRTPARCRLCFSPPPLG